MIAREVIAQKLGQVSKKANSIECWFVLTLWFSPEMLDGSLNFKASYFESFVDAEEYFNEMVEKREKMCSDEMPYQVIWNKDSIYSKDFPIKVNKELSDWNVRYFAL